MKRIVVHVTHSSKGAALPASAVARLVRAICRRFRLAGATVGITVMNDRLIRRLNGRFLKKNRCTDCLSFDLSEPRSESGRVFEIIVNGQKAKREACLRGHSPRAELALYIVHGLLHNFGFDDSTSAQAAEMHAMEDEILRQQGFGPVYYRVAPGK